MTSTSLSEWERSFLRDMQARLNRYGPRTQLSEKQYRTLMRLADPEGRKVRRSPPMRHGRNWQSALGATVSILFLVGFIGYLAAERFPELLGPLAGVTAAKTITGRTTHVRDGDTIEVSGIPIRFGSLDCAEVDTAQGQRASARMRQLVAGQTLTCHLNGRTSYDRKIGSCQLSDGRDVAAVMIREGYCARYW